MSQLQTPSPSAKTHPICIAGHSQASTVFLKNLSGTETNKGGREGEGKGEGGGDLIACMYNVRTH